MILIFVGCISAPGPQATTPPSSSADTADTTDTLGAADTAGTADNTGTDCGAEVLLDWIDEDCDGFADELGFGDSVDDVIVGVIVYGPWNELGYDLDAGSDGYGVPWLAVGGRDGVGFERLPTDDVLDVWVQGNEIYTSWRGVVTNWDASLVGAVEGRISAYVGEGTISEDDSVATIERWTGALHAADLDGDGVDELLSTDASVVVWGPPETWPDPRLTIVGNGFGGVSTPALRVKAADVTGDGVAEIIAGADALDEGIVWVLPGDVEGTFAPEDLGVAIREPNGDPIGDVTATGDVTGDGWVDVVCGGRDMPDEWSGRARVIPGPISEDRTTADAVLELVGLSDRDEFPTFASTLPDEDGDGADEVVIQPTGKWLQIVRGGRTGTLGPEDADRVLVVSDGDEIGWYHQPVDLDQDGVSDLVTGVPWSGVAGESPDTSFVETILTSGAVWLLEGPFLE